MSPTPRRRGCLRVFTRRMPSFKLVRSGVAGYDEVMFRVPILLLLAVSLLICPLRCLSCQVQPLAEKSVVASGCECCRHAEPGSEAPIQEDSPAQDCQCPDCICDGATLPIASICVNRVAQTGWECLSWSTFREATSPTFEDPNRRFFAGYQGRAALIAYQVWQI